jgi:hypothetical protein
MRNRFLLGTLRWSYAWGPVVVLELGGLKLFMSEVPLYMDSCQKHLPTLPPSSGLVPSLWAAWTRLAEAEEFYVAKVTKRMFMWCSLQELPRSQENAFP